MSTTHPIVHQPTLDPQSIKILTDKSDLVSHEIREIISYKPHWFIRHGIVIMGLVVLAMLLLSWVIRYPDIIQAPMRIVAMNAPKLAVAKSEGRLVKLLVENQQHIEQNQPLAFLQSSADHQQVWQLKEWITQAEKAAMRGNIDTLFYHPVPALNELGEMQPVWQEFLTVFQETKETLRQGYYRQKMTYLTQELGFLEEQEKVLYNQKELLGQDYQLQYQEYLGQEKLSEEKVIAPLELSHDKSKLLAKKGTLEQIESQLVNSKISKHNKEKELFELRKVVQDQQYRFSNALANCKSKVEAWVQQFIVVSPEAGKVQFITLLQVNQHVSIGQPLFYVTPPQTNYFGEIAAGQNGFGKIAVGQQVIIKVASYPQAEFGYLKGNIQSISTIPVKDSMFLIQVSLPAGLKTNYQKSLVFTDNLRAQAEIITEDKRLIEKLFNQLKVLTDR
ncbi:MAG: HlyD family efflux transporter periplasmic adaptor subunit [Bacteroidota bacterium]